jgi:hypothetical protein
MDEEPDHCSNVSIVTEHGGKKKIWYTHTVNEIRYLNNAVGITVSCTIVIV